MTREEIESKIAAALALLDSAVQQYKPKMVVGLMSGGDDSLPACYVASLHPAFSGILHINTGIGIEATREHVRKVCAERKWKLWEYKAEGVYERFVERIGFPSPSMHGQMYHLLKKDQIMLFERDMGLRGKGNLIVYAAGRRRQESVRRGIVMANDGHTKQYRHGVYCDLIHDWSREDCGHAREYAGIKRNPVSEHLGKSGECLCGAFAKPGDLDEIAFWYPETAAYIRALEAKAKAAGFPWGWEESPPDWFLQMRRGQCDLFADAASVPPEMQHLCHSCNKQDRALEEQAKYFK